MLRSIMLRSADITTVVTQAARDAGFELAGVAPVDDAPELEHFPRWIAAGHAGGVKNIPARPQPGALKPASPAHPAPSAPSGVGCGINLNTEPTDSPEATEAT